MKYVHLLKHHFVTGLASDLFYLYFVTDVLNGTPALMNAVTAFQKKGKLNRDTVKRVRV